jgi:hypothetical protein
MSEYVFQKPKCRKNHQSNWGIMVLWMWHFNRFNWGIFDLFGHPPIWDASPEDQAMRVDGIQWELMGFNGNCTPTFER